MLSNHLLNLLAFVAVLGVLIFFHELGHFLAARLVGVGVEVFSLGFGPRLFGKKIGMTDYRVCAVPLGGYVKMVGEEPGSETEVTDTSLSFFHKPVWARAVTVAAGPLFNILLAAIIFYLVYVIGGLTYRLPLVGGLAENGVAKQAGIRIGDRITSIGGKPVNKWEDMADLIQQSKGAPTKFTLLRSGTPVTVVLAAKKTRDKNLFGEPVDHYLIGVTDSGEEGHEKTGPFRAIGLAAGQTWFWCRITVEVVIKIFEGVVSPKNLGGPIFIYQETGRQAQQGLGTLVLFVAVLSVNLGIINLFPIPILDGGLLVFLAIEAMMGKPLSLRAREKAQQVGIALLVLLMAFVFYNDIYRILTKG